MLEYAIMLLMDPFLFDKVIALVLASLFVSCIVSLNRYDRLFGCVIWNLSNRCDGRLALYHGGLTEVGLWLVEHSVKQEQQSTTEE